MVFVDTSVWVDYLKGKNSELVSEINMLLDKDEIALAAPVWIEILSGASRAELSKIKRVFSALPRFYPEKDCWDQIEVWIEQGSQQGHRFASGDLLIAAIGFKNEGKIWSLDSDFKRLAKLQFVDTYSPL